jgi:hypothetical protein
VTAGNPLVNQDDASVGTVIDRNLIDRLPLNGRGIQTLIELTPGVILMPVIDPSRGQFGLEDDPLAPITAKFFGEDPFAPASPHVTVSTPEGKMLLEMSNWSMTEPTYDDGNASVLNDKRPADAPFYRVSATFVSPNDEHYYGLGQQLQGFFDLRGHRVEAWHDYDATGGESVGVPFIVTNHGYGLVWDNPSRTTLEAGFNEETKWTSEIGDRDPFGRVVIDVVVRRGLEAAITAPK